MYKLYNGKILVWYLVVLSFDLFSDKYTKVVVLLLSISFILFIFRHIRQSDSFATERFFREEDQSTKENDKPGF